MFPTMIDKNYRLMNVRYVVAYREKSHIRVNSIKPADTCFQLD